MWKSGGDADRTLEVDITAHEQDRSFTFSLIQGGLRDKKKQVLDEVTYRNLSMALNELTDPTGAPAPESFVDFGSLLFDVVLPEPIQLALLKHDGPLVFSTQELSLAWELLCADSRFLSLTHPFSRKLPMQEMMFGELLGGPSPGAPEEPPAALIIANPTGDLPESVEEAEEVRAIFEQHDVDCDILIGPAQCTHLNIMARHMRRRAYRFIHLSCHARYLDDQETSAIQLADGRMIMAQELQRTFKGEPVVFLNSCWSAKESGKSGETRQHIGSNVVRTLNDAFTAGNRSGHARAIIGSMWWIADTVGRGLAGRFYSEVLQGHSLGKALQLARLHVSEAVDDPALWSTYVLFGDPNLKFHSVSETPSPEESSAPVEPADSAPATASIPGDTSMPADDGPSKAATEFSHKKDTSDRERSGADLFRSSSGKLPWSDDVRAAFVGAMASMSIMKWKIFSTVHLVLGLTYVENGLVARALERKDIEPRLARRALRELFSRNAPSDDTDDKWEISDNLGSILATSRRLAEEQGRSDVSEANVVGALLEHTEAGGLMLLTCLEIDQEELAADIRSEIEKGPRSQLVKRDGGENNGQPDTQTASVSGITTEENTGTSTVNADMMLPSGELDTSLFHSEALAALEEASLLAYRSYWPDLRSPHIFLGILNRPGSRLAVHMQKTGVSSPEAIATTFLASLTGQYPIDARVRPPRLHREFLSENTLAVLREAQQRASAKNHPTVCESDLLEAILQNPSNIITSTFLKAGIQPERLQLPDEAPPDPLRKTSPKPKSEPFEEADALPMGTSGEVGGKSQKSEAALALIQRSTADGVEWLVQWNTAWEQYHFVGGHRNPGESYRDCLLREIEEELHVSPSQCLVGESPRYHLEFLAASERTQTDTHYLLKVFDVTLMDSTLQDVLTRGENRWISAAEIENGRTQDGRVVASNVQRVWQQHRSSGGSHAP